MTVFHPYDLSLTTDESEAQSKQWVVVELGWKSSLDLTR